VPSWDKRIVDRPVEELSAVFQSAAADPSVSVRKLAAEHLIRVGPQGSDRIIALLEQDRSKPVFERMDYYRRKWFGDRTEEMI
jgi:HEAT repeat protein